MSTPSATAIVLADDVKARVERRALERAQDVSEYVNARLREIFGLDDEIREKVRRGRDDIAAGRIVDDDKVEAWLESYEVSAEAVEILGIVDGRRDRP